MRRVLALVTLALCTACQARAPAAPIATPLPTFTPAPESPTPVPVLVQAVAPQPAPQPAVKPQAAPSPASLPLSLLAGRSGADLRVSLDVLLDENAFLAAMTVESASAARLDEQIGLASMLDENAVTLAGIVGAVKGPSTAQTLLEAWREQPNDLVSYVQGQSPNTEAHIGPIAESLATGDFSQAAASDVLHRRLRAEEAFADSVRTNDSVRTAQQLADLLATSDELARPLSSAMAARVPDLLPANTEGADIDVRLHLTNGLTAWTLLTANAAEAAADGRSADAQALTALAGSTAEELAAEMNSAFSSTVGSEIADRLRAETAAYVFAATGTNRPQAAADIDRLRGEIDSVLSGANPLLAPGLLNQQLRASDQPLLTAADAFAARDFASGFARVHESVRQTQKPAETLALAIVDRYPARYLVLTTPSPSP
ncbi:MAG: hypothetical protein JOZ65_29915 [Chloroflexi bacterium]|nr:hypothetical protein [Chloroflexota bacterium]